jgi:hypothetical protein
MPVVKTKEGKWRVENSRGLFDSRSEALAQLRAIKANQKKARSKKNKNQRKRRKQ